MQKNFPVHTLYIKDVEGKTNAFLNSELYDSSTLRKNPRYRVGRKLLWPYAKLNKLAIIKKPFSIMNWTPVAQP